MSWFVWASYGAKFGVLLILGVLLGLALFHSRFGFTSAWRQLIAVGNGQGQGQGQRAHTLLLGTAATLVVDRRHGSGLFGSTPAPTPGALGLALFVGATLFAIGMQLGGACASGTLSAVGSGQSTIVFTLGGFIAGSVLYTWAYPVLSGWPEFNEILLADHVGWFGSWAITIAVLLGIVAVSRVVQQRRTPPPVDTVPTASGFARIVRGSWPVLVGALVLGVLAGAVFFVSGGIWGVTRSACGAPKSCSSSGCTRRVGSSGSRRPTPRRCTPRSGRTSQPHRHRYHDRRRGGGRGGRRLEDP